MPIPVTSQFLPLSLQIASAWRMMSHCWCQHHIPRARDPPTVMCSWVPPERVQFPYTAENLEVHNRMAVARPLCQLIHYSCMLIPACCFLMVCGPHRQLQMHQSEMKLSAWTCGLRHFRHCGNSESQPTIFRIRSTTPQTTIALDSFRSCIERDS